jgi:CMP-N-acetylneuraminic acid synthetase
MKELVCVVSARLASTRVPRKMVRPFADSCLLEVTLRKLLGCRNLDPSRIYLSAYEEEIKAIGEKTGVQIYHRTYESTLEPNTCDVLYRFAWDIPSEYFMMVVPTNPLLRSRTLEQAIDHFRNGSADSLFSVVEKRNFVFNPEGRLLNRFLGEEKYLASLETKLLEPIYEAANSFLIWKGEYLRRHNAFWSFSKNDPYLFPIPEDEFLDIDYPWQFRVAERIYVERLSEEEP